MKPENVTTRSSQAPRTGWIQGFVSIALGFFFLYRYASVGSSLYIALAAASLILGFLAFSRRLPGNLRDMLLSLSISLFFLDIVFYQIDVRGMLDALRSADYRFLIFSTLLIVVSFLMRAYRWGWFFPVGQSIPLTSLFSALSIGITANSVLPARVGEIIRAYVLGRREHLSKTTVFATVVLERVFDGLTILLFLLLVVVLIGVETPELQYMAAAGGVFYVTAIAVLLMVFLQERLLERWIRKLLPDSIGGKAVELLHAFAEGLASTRNLRQLAAIAVLSLLCWAVIAASFWPVLAAFDFGVPVPLYTPFLLVAVLGLGLMIPAAPAGVGIFQYACLLTLQIVFAPYAGALAPDFKEQAAAFSLVVHLSQVGPEIVMGLICFAYEGLNWQEVQTKL